MADIDLDELKREITEVIKDFRGNLKEEAKEDINKFLSKSKNRLESLAEQVANKELSDLEAKAIVMMQVPMLKSIIEKHRVIARVKAENLAKRLASKVVETLWRVVMAKLIAKFS